jgi:hypothetical protein
MTTPPANVADTMVVPCGASKLPAGSGRREGSSWGACAPMNSVKEDDPVAR